MSLVDTSTGEIVQMDESTARDLVDTIRQTGELMWRQIVRAFQGRAWVALGYSSWDEMCETEFDGARIKLPREDRREVVASLSDAGMSTRAIAAATGNARNTISNDLRDREVAQIEPPANPDDDITDAEIVEDVGPVDHKPITGLDGKTYPKPTPKPPVDRRPPLTKSAETAGWELRKAVERIERIVNDDRFATHKQQVAVQLHSHLSFTIETCQGLLDHVTTNGDTQ